MQDETDTPPITVDDIDSAPNEPLATGGGTHVSVEDLRAAFVRLGEENATLKQTLDATEKRVKTIEILDKLIEPYAKKSFVFMCTYCGVVALILLMDGCPYSGFMLPDDVLKFLVGSTATTVIGLVGMVLTGIFVGARGRNGA